MNDTLLPAALPPLRSFCCQKLARIQAAHDAAFDVWLHAKSWRTARKAAQKLNGTALQFKNHTCEQALPAVGGAEQAGEQQPPADGAPEPSPAGTNDQGDGRREPAPPRQ